jgi:high-affinity iron transporter
MRLSCDIHQHMRGYVVVAPTPWVQVCDREGRFRIAGVPCGRYILTAWHEMGDPLRIELDVAGDKPLELPVLVLTVPPATAQRGAVGGDRLAPARPWSDVVGAIGMTLAASCDAAVRPGELARARRLADDAYCAEFEASELETAVRRFLGYAQAGALERQFRAVRIGVREVADERKTPEELAQICHRLLSDLVAVTRALNSKGVSDRSRIDAVAPASGLAAIGPVPAEDPSALLRALQRGFRRVQEQAGAGTPEDASSELTTVYLTEFEPLERYLLGKSPMEVRPLEIEFNTLRGDLAGGLKGAELADRLDALSARLEALIVRLEARPAGRFSPAFIASFVTITREGIEVILIVAMLLALVAKATRAAGAQPALEPGPPARAALCSATAARARGQAVTAIWWGVALAVVASLVTALALNLLVVSAQGAARELLEGVVMLAASAVLFYVSYWLISRLEAKRWMDFLKQQAQRGLELGGRGTLALTAFLAVYREGAETSLLYQALSGSEGRTHAGFLGLAAGAAVGLVLLIGIAVLVRATSLRLPVHTFFKVSGAFLFVLAIVFAGNGVFELQNAGILFTTNLAWLGRGLPWAGLYPNLQVISVQGLLLAGALLAWAVIPHGSLGPAPRGPSRLHLAAKRG